MKRIATIVALFIAAYAGAWPVQTNSFAVRIGEQSAAQFSIPQGESRVIEALYVNGTAVAPLTGMTAEFLYKTSEMGTWWTITGVVEAASGAVRVPWDRTRDPGAPRYSGWIHLITSDGNPIYRAQVDLAMIATPGFMPNATGLTVADVDFGGLTFTNAPWLTASGVSNVVNSAVLSAVTGIGTNFMRVTNVSAGVWRPLLPGE